MIKALILAAGLGTRLKPITDNLPKPMVEVGDKPVIAYVVDNLTHYDIGDIIVNVHHLPSAVANYFGPKLYYFYEPYLLGEKKTVALLHSLIEFDNLVVTNGDTISNVNLDKMISFHFKNNASLTRFMVNNRYAGTKILSFGNSINEIDYTQEDGYYFDIGTKEKLELAKKYYETRTTS